MLFLLSKYAMLRVMNIWQYVKNSIMKKPGHRKRVFVGVSGGVDSSVSAALLLEQGYDVTGVFIRTWTPEWLPCTWRSERRDAMRVCAHLNIPFIELDLTAEYKQGVADYMISEYAAGRTPNPDVMCNREVKFGGFLSWALDRGADYVATGHYAQVTLSTRGGDDDRIRGYVAVNGVESTSNLVSNFSDSQLTKPMNTQNLFLLVTKIISQGFLSIKKIISQTISRSRNTRHILKLVKGNDPSKDQSYFLWTLSREQLEHVLFPIGHLPKSAVRELALQYKLPTAVKKDSQGICFIGMVDMKQFLKHYIDVTPGDVLDTQGKVIGNHEGAVLYTLGERHGFTIIEKGTDDRAYYVIGKNLENNVIVVSQDPVHAVTEQKKSYILENTIWRSAPIDNTTYTAHVRYHGEDKEVKIICTDHTYIAEFTEPDYKIAPGQYIVIYDVNICIGGGIVK